MRRKGEQKMIETTCLNDEKKTDDLPPSLLEEEETVGAGLDQLDVLTEKLVRHRELRRQSGNSAEAAAGHLPGRRCVGALLRRFG